jgi:uncharacterized protein YndB with AHSA1/START domain
LNAGCHRVAFKVIQVCAIQPLLSTARRSKSTLHRIYPLKHHIVGEYIFIMRNETLGNSKTDSSRQHPMRLEKTGKHLQRMDRRLGTNLTLTGSESVRLRPYAAVLPSQFEAATAMEIRAWMEIPAEQQRVFSALSNPEYIECWMGIAEEDESHRWVPLGSEGVLCISMARSGARVHVYKVRIQSNPGSLVFFWESIEPNAEHASRVDIVLKGRQHRCILELRHSGIRTLKEGELYSGIWRRSLGNLRTLMQ